MREHTTDARDAHVAEPDGPTDDGHRTVSARVEHQLRHAILDGRLRPGQRVRQEELAKELGTSRIPVREALRKLESEGLVTIVPHVGARVARLDFAEHNELYLLREAVEPMVLEHSVPRLTDDTLSQLRELSEEIASTSDERMWLHVDRRFHLLCYQGADMPRAQRMIETFWNSSQHYRRAYYEMLAPERLALVDADHRLLVDAMERRDPADARDRLRLHIRRTRVTLVEHAELFDPEPHDAEATR